MPPGACLADVTAMTGTSVTAMAVNSEEARPRARSASGWRPVLVSTEAQRVNRSFLAVAVITFLSLTSGAGSSAPITTAPATAQATPARQDILIVTEIRAPDPQAGMKSTHRVKMDFDQLTVTDEYLTGTTHFFGVSLPSIRNNFRVSGVEFAGNKVKFHVAGETASGIGVVPNINYRFHIEVSRQGTTHIKGCHDGYPAYEIRYRHVMLYWFKHKPIAVLNLFGTCDVSIDFRSGPNNL